MSSHFYDLNYKQNNALYLHIVLSCLLNNYQIGYDISTMIWKMSKFVSDLVVNEYRIALNLMI